MTILNIFQEKIGSTWGLDYVGLVVGIIFFTCGVLVIFSSWNKEYHKFDYLNSVYGIFSLALAVVIIICSCSVATSIYETRYQILSTDPAISTEDFAKNYEIVSQDGLILTIRERN